MIKLLTYLSTKNIWELNKLIYVWTKLFSEKNKQNSAPPQKKTIQILKTWSEKSKRNPEKKSRQQAKMI